MGLPSQVPVDCGHERRMGVSHPSIPASAVCHALASPPCSAGPGVQVGTARRANTDDDDEFDYAFDGGKREGATHKQVGGWAKTRHA